MAHQVKVSGHYRNVCDVIVPNDLCAGCGVCAGICPADAIRIEWNRYGEYRPMEQIGQCTDCGLCLAACPFWNQEEDELTLAQREFGHQDGIRFDSVAGFFLDIFSGYSTVDDHRIRGAGGGLTTWLLEKMLVERVVDRVCCVIPDGDADVLFRYFVTDSVEGVRRASRSAYYPVELSAVLREILSVEGKYAIVGLPCVLKGLRLAMRDSDEARKRIVAMVGLFCGQQKSKFFAEYLCALAGGAPRDLISAAFRVKDAARSDSFENRFEFSCRSGDSVTSGNIYWSGGMGWLWGHDCFKLNACNFCDDITAEVADIAFGDAVARPYCYGTAGTSFAIVRSAFVHDWLLGGRSRGEVVADRVPLNAILERQHVVVLQKRDDLAQRLYLARRKGGGSYIPVKRFAPRRRSSPRLNWDMALRDRMRVVRRRGDEEHRHDGGVVAEGERALTAIPEEFARRNWRYRLHRYLSSALIMSRSVRRDGVSRVRTYLRRSSVLGRHR